jgi:hypothetical protein
MATLPVSGFPCGWMTSAKHEHDHSFALRRVRRPCGASCVALAIPRLAGEKSPASFEFLNDPARDRCNRFEPSLVSMRNTFPCLVRQ